MNFINIHTHYKPLTDGELSIYNNRVGADTQMVTNTPFSIGIHPWDIPLIAESDLATIETYLNHPNCLAIGECGLDKLSSNLNVQQTVFSKQLKLAIEYNKPVLIHCVKAFDELIEITEPFVKLAPLIIHGFNKSEELAKQLVNKGFYLSLPITCIQKKDFNFNNLDIHKIFLETDDNFNVSIKDVYQLFAQKLNMDIEILKAQINRNFDSLFL